MAKKDQRGLPPEFDLQLPADKPVQLGDYLEEEEQQARRRQPEPPAWTPPAQPVPAQYAPPAYAPAQGYPPRYLSRQQLRPGSAPRKQLNATPETMRMLDELLMQVRQQSLEKDVRTSELFHAMVLAVYEARAHMDLSGVPPRGRWGSPTAASLPVALKNALMDAIARARSARR